MADFEYLTEGLFRPDLVGLIDGHPVLVGRKCKQCGDVRFPPAPACPQCHAALADLEAIPLAVRGTVVTATRIDRSAPGFETPYLVGAVALPEGVRVMAQIREANFDAQTAIGKPASLEIAELFQADGVVVLGYRFVVEVE